MSFSKASSVRLEGYEACHKQPRCPFNGSIVINSLEWFCVKCRNIMDTPEGRRIKERPDIKVKKKEEDESSTI